MSESTQTQEPSARVGSGDGSCADFIPVEMRHDASPSPAQQSEAAVLYRQRLHRVRRGLGIAEAALLAVWAVGFAWVLHGVDGDSIPGGIAHLVAILTPVVMLVVAPILYARWRHNTRVDDLEPHHEDDAMDRFPRDRFVSPASRLSAVLVLTTTAVVMMAIPWGVVAIDEALSRADVVIATVLDLAAVAVLGIVVVRGRRAGIVSTSGGLAVTSLFGRRVVPWTAITELRLDLVETPSRYGTDRSLRLAAGGSGAGVRHLAWPLMTGTSETRARARHNIGVADRWTTAHGLERGPGLEAAVRWAEGDISLDELMAGANLVHAGVRAD